MKKKTLFVCRAGAIALLAMVATACANEVLDTPDTNKSEQLISIEAEAGLQTDKPQTRLGYTGATGRVTVTWKYSATATNNDKFTVFQPDGKHEFALKETPTGDGKTGSFDGELTKSNPVTSQTLYAFYPASAVGTSTDVDLNIATQTGLLADLTKYDYMTASAGWNGKDTKVDFRFTHLMAMLRIDTKLPEDKYPLVSSVVVTGLDQKRTLDLKSGKWSNTDKGEITLTKSPATGTANHSFYLMVFPTTETTKITELKVVITLTGGGSYTKTFTSAAGITLAGGKRYSINFGYPSDITGGSDSEDIPGGGDIVIPWT